MTGRVEPDTMSESNLRLARFPQADPWLARCSRSLLQLATVDLTVRRDVTDGRRSDGRTARKPALTVQPT